MRRRLDLALRIARQRRAEERDWLRFCGVRFRFDPGRFLTWDAAPDLALATWEWPSNA